MTPRQDSPGYKIIINYSLVLRMLIDTGDNVCLNYVVKSIHILKIEY